MKKILLAMRKRHEEKVHERKYMTTISGKKTEQQRTHLAYVRSGVQPNSPPSTFGYNSRDY